MTAEMNILTVKDILKIEQVLVPTLFLKIPEFVEWTRKHAAYINV